MNRTLSLALVAALALPAAAVPSLEDAYSAASRGALHSAVRAASFTPGFSASRDADEELMDLLDDRDPAVRAQAAKALKNSVLNNRRVEDRLRVLASSSGEDESVRHEAIKSLSMAAEQSNNVRRDLIAIAESRWNSDRLRAIACKALWTSVTATDARRALTSLLQDGSAPAAVRAAAAWGLWFDAAGTGATQRALTEAVSDRSLDASVRLQAVKSLYTAMNGQRSIRDAVRAVAEDSSAPASLRADAVLAHHWISTEYQVQRWLRDLATSQLPAEIRAAAVQAQTQGLTPELARHFHLSHWNRRFLDPLEAE